jgi:hypothetical protein
MRAVEGLGISPGGIKYFRGGDFGFKDGPNIINFYFNNNDGVSSYTLVRLKQIIWGSRKSE